MSVGHSISSSIPDLVHFESFKVSYSPGLLHDLKAHLFLHIRVAPLISLLWNYFCSLHREHIGHLSLLSPSCLVAPRRGHSCRFKIFFPQNLYFSLKKNKERLKKIKKKIKISLLQCQGEAPLYSFYPFSQTEFPGRQSPIP